MKVDYRVGTGYEVIETKAQLQEDKIISMKLQHGIVSPR